LDFDGAPGNLWQCVSKEYFHKDLHPTTKNLQFFSTKVMIPNNPEGITCNVQKLPSDQVKISHQMDWRRRKPARAL
jgi:hypothetical protein